MNDLWMPNGIDDDMALFDAATADIESGNEDTVIDFIAGLIKWSENLVNEIDKTLIEARRYGTIHLQSPCNPNDRIKNVEEIKLFAETANNAALGKHGTTVVIPNVVADVDKSFVTFYEKRAKAIVRSADSHTTIVEWLGTSGNIIPTELTTISNTLFIITNKLNELASIFNEPHHTQTVVEKTRDLVHSFNRMTTIIYETLKEVNDLVNDYTRSGFTCPPQLKGL